MKNTTLILVALIGSVVSGHAIDLVDTNIVGAVNTGSTDIYAIDDATGTSYNIANSSITAADGQTVIGTVVENLYALGSGGMRSTGAAHDINIDGGTVAGSSGGSIVSDPSLNSKVCNANGGNGMYLQNVNLSLSDATISGGNGGSMSVVLASEDTSAHGGVGVQLLGISSLFATNTTISGGQGGFVYNKLKAAQANGGAGILINGSGTTIDLNLVNTTVTGGDGGEANKDSTKPAFAAAGDGLLISGGATVTINGGTYVGGEGGSINYKSGNSYNNVKQADGVAVNVQASSVNLAGGNFVGGILFSSGASTLAVKDTFTSDTPIRQTDGTVAVTEWHDGQMMDVTVSSGTMNLNYNETNAFNVDGVFTVAPIATAKANFNSGLTVQSGGVLSLGISTSTAKGALTKSGSTVQTTRSGTTLGKLSSASGLTLENGTKWVINDTGTSAFTIGQVFTLASVTAGTISNGLDAADVLYVGANGSAGWLGLITNVVVSGDNVNAIYGQKEINEVLGLVGDNSEFGQAMADLSMLVSQTNTALYNTLANVTPYLSEARIIMTNSYYRVSEVARVLSGLQSVYADQIKDRTRSNLNSMEVGYPVAASPAGAGGWDWLRGMSDRMESGFSSDSIRHLSDRTEDALGYSQVKGAMNSLKPDVELEDVGLPPQWQIWGRGYGSGAKQDTRNGFAGYDATIGGGMIGIDRRINNVLVGFGGGYNRANITGYENNDAIVDSGHATMYLSAHGNNLFFDLNVDGGINSVETKMTDLGYAASFDAFTAGLYVGGGFAMPLTDYLVLTPEASLLTSYFSHDSYNDKSSMGLPTKQFDSYNQVSPVSTVGATLALVHKIDFLREEIAVQPEFRAHWLRDFNADMDADSYAMVGGVNTVDTPLMATEEDLYKIGGGVRIAQWASESTEVGVDFDYTFGEDYEAYVVSGKIMHRF